MYVSANLSGPDLSCIKADFQVWSLTGGSNLEEGFLESLAGRLLGFVASALAGFVAAMALLAPVCRFVEASASPKEELLTRGRRGSFQEFGRDIYVYWMCIHT